MIVGYRRQVIGLYLNNKETRYSNKASVANYDRYSEGITAIERVYIKRAIEY